MMLFVSPRDKRLAKLAERRGVPVVVVDSPRLAAWLFVEYGVRRLPALVLTDRLGETVVVTGRERILGYLRGAAG